MALHNYHGAHNAFPPGRLTPDYVLSGNVQTSYTNYNPIGFIPPPANSWSGFRSVHVFIFPYLEDVEGYDSMNFSVPTTPRMTNGPAVSNFNYTAYAAVKGHFLCPSDPNEERRITENSYRYNFGGSTPYAGALNTTTQLNMADPASGNGAFTIGRSLRSKDFVDGLSKTIFFSERTKGTGRDPALSPPGPEDVITMPSRTQGLVADLMWERCRSAPRVADAFNFTSMGRWLNGSDFSNGWPFGVYSSAMYNHFAPPNWEGLDCGN